MAREVIWACRGAAGGFQFHGFRTNAKENFISPLWQCGRCRRCGVDDQVIVGLNLYETLLRLEYSSGKEIGFTHKGGDKLVGGLLVNLSRRTFLDDTSSVHDSNSCGKR